MKMNKEDLRLALQLLNITREEWLDTAKSDRRTKFRSRFLNKIKSLHPDKIKMTGKVSTFDDERHIRVLTDFNQQYLASTTSTPTLSQLDTSASAASSEKKRSSSEPNLKQRAFSSTENTHPQNALMQELEKMRPEEFLKILFLNYAKQDRLTLDFKEMCGFMDVDMLYVFASGLLRRNFLFRSQDPDVYDQLLMSLLTRLKDIQTTQHIFKLTLKMDQLIDRCLSLYAEESDIVLNEPLLKLLQSMQRLNQTTHALRQKNLIAAYKAIYNALLEGEGLLHQVTTAYNVATIVMNSLQKASLSFFSKKQDSLPSASIPAKPDHPWDDKSDEQFYKFINDSSSMTSLIEQKAALLAIGLVDGYISEDRLLTMIYIDKCPPINYLGIKRDAVITPCEEDGGYHLVNAFISSNMIQMSEPTYAPFHRRAELVLDNPNLSSQYYGKYNGIDVLLNSQYAFPEGSLPARINMHIKRCCDVLKDPSFSARSFF